MSVWALIDNAAVTNIIDATQDFVNANCPWAVSLDGLVPQPGIGWQYVGGQFIPPSPAPAAKKTTFSRLEFRRMFPLAELIALDNYAASTTLTADQKATVTTIVRNAEFAEFIDVADPLTQQGIEYLYSIGLISQTTLATLLGQ